MKWISRISKMLLVVGLIIIVGTVGACDYATELGQYYPEKNLIVGFLIGYGCAVPYFLSKVIKVEEVN